MDIVDCRVFVLRKSPTGISNTCFLAELSFHFSSLFFQTSKQAIQSIHKIPNSTKTTNQILERVRGKHLKSIWAFATAVMAIAGVEAL